MSVTLRFGTARLAFDMRGHAICLIVLASALAGLSLNVSAL